MTTTETPRTASLIARAIVHLNFNEPEEAQKVLFDALTEFNFEHGKEITDGNRPAAA
jgi:hypothetical protein